MDEKWDKRFLELAELIATWSKDPGMKVGAVIVRPDKTIASTGFNGFPKYLVDAPSLYEDRDTKLSRVIHAELNAILHAREPLDGYTIYTWPPCDRCAAHIVQAGLKRVVYRESKIVDRWKESTEKGIMMFLEAGMEIKVY